MMRGHSSASLLKATLVAASLFSSSVASAEETKDSGGIDLDGVVKIEFDPNDAEFADYSEFFERRRADDVQLEIRPDGQIVTCEPLSTDLPTGFAEKVCKAIEADAIVMIEPGYDMAGRTGRIRIGFSSFSEIEREALDPIKFVKYGKDIGVSIVIGEGLIFDANGCFSSNVAGDPFMSGDSFDRACDAFTALPEKKRKKACRYDGEHLGEQHYLCAVKTRALPEGTPPQFSAYLRTPHMLVETVWVGPTESELASMYLGKARLSAELRYPGSRLRDDFNSRTTVLIGFQNDGAIISCRPIKSIGDAFVDNSTCRQILRTGRVLMDGESWNEAKPRFLVQPVAWSFPQ